MPVTLEALETQGVPVLGFRTDEFPAFYTRGSGCRADTRCDSPGEIARVSLVDGKFVLEGHVDHVHQVYYYVLEPPPGMDLSELRSLQDWYLRYPLQTVDGVSEVASVGGFVKQYQITVDPNKLRAYNIPISEH